MNNVFSELIEQSGIDPRELQRAQLNEEWEEIAGEELARNLSIHKLDGDRLLLKASDPSWSHQASMMTEQIKENVNDHFDSTLVSTVKIVS